MFRRLLGVFALLPVMCVGVLAGPVLADVEEEDALEEVEHEEVPSYEEIGTGTETSREFRPEPYEQPTVFGPMVIPLAVAGGLVLFVVMVLYLLWHPRFSEESRQKRRGK
jgi:hypothetical protein